MKSVSSDLQHHSQSAQKLLNHVLHHLNFLHHNITNSNHPPQQLQSHSTHIQTLISIITHISPQTNLLPLNPSIEPPRVPEQGKRFPLLADQ
ncbi:methyl-accepting chemotaxis protein, partial [Bacillus sp. WP8]|uniref:methyl-accepting chemotaxis protein n=1 Tax=Bacillus sp. WP8 TaxID=756828 RepID=UPI0021B2FCD9